MARLWEFTHKDKEKFVQYSETRRKQTWWRKMFVTPFDGNAIFEEVNQSTVHFGSHNYFCFDIPFKVFMRLKLTRSDLLLNFFSYAKLFKKSSEDLIEKKNKRMMKKIGGNKDVTFK